MLFVFKTGPLIGLKLKDFTVSASSVPQVPATIPGIVSTGHRTQVPQLVWQALYKQLISQLANFIVIKDDFVKTYGAIH